MLSGQSPRVNASFPASVHVSAGRGQPFVSFVSRQNDMGPGLMLFNGRFDIKFDRKETNETHSDLNVSPQQWRKIYNHNHMSHAMFLQYYVGTRKTNTSPKITSACNARCKI
jgi:hypothetical protein